MDREEFLIRRREIKLRIETKRGELFLQKPAEIKMGWSGVAPILFSIGKRLLVKNKAPLLKTVLAAAGFHFLSALIPAPKSEHRNGRAHLTLFG